MPAKRLPCRYCTKPFWASRSDSLWCSPICRARARTEDAKFKYPAIPRSGIPGLTFNRVISRWELRLLKPQKYVGAFTTLQEAAEFLRSNGVSQYSTQ